MWITGGIDLANRLSSSNCTFVVDLKTAFNNTALATIGPNLY